MFSFILVAVVAIILFKIFHKPSVLSKYKELELDHDNLVNMTKHVSNEKKITMSRITGDQQIRKHLYYEYYEDLLLHTEDIVRALCSTTSKEALLFLQQDGDTYTIQLKFLNTDHLRFKQA